MLRIFRKIVVAGLTIGMVALQMSVVPSAEASVGSWQRGASIVPTNNTDFSSGNFQQSLRNLKATGATYVDLVVPYYQSNVYSTDVQGGYNTPTDDSLGAGIDYAHSIGL